MTLARPLRFFGCAAVAVVTLIAACSSSSPDRAAPPDASDAVAALTARYRELQSAGGRVFALEPAASAVRIYAFRAGPAGKLGHNHVIYAPRFTGFFHLPQAGASAGQFELLFRFDELDIDPPGSRAPLGSAFASELTREMIEGTRDHMLGEDNFQADRYPFIRVRSLQIAGEAPRYAAHIEVELHGQKRDQWVPLDVQGLPGSLTVKGAFVLRQTDFGVKPYDVLGLIAVQDEVVIEFTLVGK
jgi:hypothetical protein